MNVVFDTASAEAQQSGTNTGFTAPSITITNNNPLLLVGLFSSVNLSSLACTYNSVSMTQLSTSNNYNGTEFIYVFGLLNPATGSAISPVFTWTSVNGTQVAQSVSYIGATALPSTTHNASGLGTSLSASLTTDSTPNSIVVMFAANDAANFTAGTGSTIRGTPNDGIGWADSNGNVSASASYSMSLGWTGSTNTHWGTIQMEISPKVLASTLTAAQGSFALTGIDALFVLAHHLTISLAQGAYTLTGQTLSITTTLWPRIAKSVTSFANATLHTSSWLNTTKDSTSFTNRSKS